MARDLRGLIFVAALVIIGAVFIAVPRVNFDVFNFEFDRGNDDTFLGLNLGLDLQGGTHLVYDIVTEDGEPPTPEDVEGIRAIIERRVNAFGVSEPTVQVLGNPPDRILIQLPGQSESSLNVFIEDGDATLDDIKAFFEADLAKSGVEIVENEDGSLIITFDDFDGSEAETWRTQFQEKYPTTIRATFEYEIIVPEEEEESETDVDGVDDTEAEDAEADSSESDIDDQTDSAETDASADSEESDTEEEAQSGEDTDGEADSPEADADSDSGTEEDDESIDGETEAEDAGTVDEESAQEEIPDPTRIAPSTEDVQAAFEAAGFTDVEVSDGTDTVLFLTDELGNFTQGDAIFFEAEFTGQFKGREFDDEGNLQPSDAENLTRQLADVGNFASLRTPGNIVQWTVAGGVQEAKALIGSTAQLEFRERKCGPIVPPPDAPAEEWPPDGLSDTEWLLLRCASPLYFTEQATNISADDLDDAFPSIEGTPPEPVVTIVFNESGRDAFFEVTGRVARNRDVLAIYLDNVELIAPTVNTQGGQGIADGRAIISGGDFTTERVRTLAIQLRSGALPAELELTEERSVDAILGADSLQRSLVAGGIGLVLLIIFMISYYKVPGTVASISLASYTLMLLAIFKLVPVTMTLSGAAAVILSLGFAVDANVLIAERTKEELRAGRGLLAALNTGFDRAWPSIRDGNISTIITAVVLFWFGDRFSTSIMQGFALTLGIGVLLSMFTAFFASRLMLRFIARVGGENAPNMFVPVRDPGHQT